MEGVRKRTITQGLEPDNNMSCYEDIKHDGLMKDNSTIPASETETENKNEYLMFTDRKAELIKKAYELSTLKGTEVMLLVVSETGAVSTFATHKLQPVITSEAGKTLIGACLNSSNPCPSSSDTNHSENCVEIDHCSQNFMNCVAPPTTCKQQIADTTNFIVWKYIYVIIIICLLALCMFACRIFYSVDK
ncbi:uncharacterized protein LOC126844152 [Adelges cooleyi]|uniref:uncharacterized protein LOC126844152 n=1 Tax=Adelges cooleyi TaxID=133065 RepID=UPI00217FF36B|nr:uncharacterized protein LOC126844152 [Adelges cooleyi]